MNYCFELKNTLVSDIAFLSRMTIGYIKSHYTYMTNKDQSIKKKCWKGIKKNLNSDIVPHEITIFVFFFRVKIS